MADIDVLIPVGDDAWLDRAVASVGAQVGVSTRLVAERTGLDQCAARNALLDQTDSEWVQFLDADDELLGSDKLARQLQRGRDTHADLVYGDLLIKDERARTQLVLRAPERLVPAARTPQIGACLFRRSAFPAPAFRAEFADGGAVHDLLYRMTASGARSVHDPVICALYRTGHKATPQDRTVGVARARKEAGGHPRQLR